jgi:hypothetical protein
MRDDLPTRWNNHLNECLGEGWGVGEDLMYAPGKRGEEPIPVLNTNDARFYTVWLHLHGYITAKEKRWLLADIEQTRKEERL